MKPLTIADSATIILGLQDEIRRTEESRYDHRLHGVLLVAHGMTCPEVAALLGDAEKRRVLDSRVRGERLSRTARGGTVRAAETPKREAPSGNQHRSSANAARARLERKSVGRQDAGDLDRARVRDRLGGTAMPASVSAVGISATQASSRDCASRS